MLSCELEYMGCQKQHIFSVKAWKKALLSEGCLESVKLEKAGFMIWLSEVVFKVEVHFETTSALVLPTPDVH